MNSLPARLLVVVAIAVIPALPFQAYTEKQARQARQQLVADEARRLVSLVSAEQRRIIEGAGQMLAVVGAVPFVRDTIAYQCQRFLTDLASAMPRFDGIAVAGLDGHPLCASVPYDPRADISDRAWFQKALTTGTTVLGEYGSGILAARPAVPIARPFKRQDGAAGGVIIGELSLSRLEQRLESIPLPAGAAVAVRDRNGLLLARWPDQGQFIGTFIPSRSAFILQATQPGITRLARVLLIDDEEPVREVLAMQLEEAGFAVISAASGRQALEQLAGMDRVDVLVTDLSIPGMDGLAVIHVVHERLPGLPAVLLTGYAGDSGVLARRSAADGTFSLLRKPIRAADLIKYLRTLLAEDGQGEMPRMAVS